MCSKPGKTFNLMKIYFASDHAGFELKSKLVAFVRSLGHEAEDCGSAVLAHGDDFPDYMMPMARKVIADKGSIGVALGASGQGEAMAANRVKGARAAVYYGEAMHAQTDAEGNILNIVQSMRAHNDANILSLGARFVSEDAAQAAVKLFIETPFSGDGRHLRRIAKIDA